jgi:hypothetical protein
VSQKIAPAEWFSTFPITAMNAKGYTRMRENIADKVPVEAFSDHVATAHLAL